MKNHQLLALRPFNLSLGIALIAVLSQSINAGPAPNQNTQTRPPVQGQDTTRNSGAGPLTATKSSPTKNSVVDYGVFTPGKKVYSSGTADIVVQVLNVATVHPVPRGHPRPDSSPFNQGLYLLSPGRERFIASNKDLGKVINLGKLPPGELVFAIRSIEGDYFRTGDATNNLDGLVHADVRTFGSASPIEIWFEDAFGKKGTGRSDRDINDLVVRVSGGLDEGDMSNLAKAVQQQPAANRETLISELKKVDPKAAAAISLPAQPAAK